MATELQANSNTPLTPEEIALSETGSKFADLKASDLFSSSASYATAARVRRLNPVRYRALKLEWAYETGQIPRPDSYFK